jgi:hypothetical protein
MPLKNASRRLSEEAVVLSFTFERKDGVWEKSQSISFTILESAKKEATRQQNTLPARNKWLEYKTRGFSKL